MRKCLVCGKVNENYICTKCGFDGSRNYEAFPTFGPVNGDSVSGRKAAYQARQSNLHRCVCGSTQFNLDQTTLQPVCAQCGRKYQTQPIANPAASQAAKPFKAPLATHKSIAGGHQHSIALKNDGTAMVMGHCCDGVTEWKMLFPSPLAALTR